MAKEGDSGAADVAHHEQGDEERARQHSGRKQLALSGRLQKNKGSALSQQQHVSRPGT